MLSSRHSSIFSRLRGLLEVTRLVRTEEDVPELLAAITRTVSDSLGYRTVAINLYRREWDDFVVSAVHGSDEAREALLGRTQTHADWEPFLEARFLRRGAYLIPAGEIDWDDHHGFTPDLPVSDDPDAWHPEDALFVPMRGADHSLVGIMSVDEPRSGRKPGGDEIDVLVAVAEHATLAVEAAQEAALAQRHREALERLLEVSTRLTSTWQTHELLELVCDAVREALSYGKVSVELLDAATGRYEPAASVGFVAGERTGETLAVDELDRLLRPELEVQGCYLMTPDDVKRLLPERAPAYRSQENGRGPHAWRNHTLIVPLHDNRGLRVGFMWVDDPDDRLVPTPGRLQLLRTFANQATTALTASAQVEAVRDSEARHRALFDASPVAIVDFDLDGAVRGWNDAAETLFGWRPEEILGRPNPMVPEDELHVFRGSLVRIARGETLRDLPFTRLRRDGSTIDLSVTAGPIRNAQGDVVGVVSLMVDRTERSRWERAVRDSEARKDAILRSTLDSIVTVDGDGLVVEFNPAAEETLGWTRADVIGFSFPTLAIAEQHRADVQEALRTGGGPLLGARCEISALRADRRAFPAEISINRVDVPGPALYAISISDVTKRKEREERARDAEAKYRTLVEQLPLATYISECSLPVRLRYVSPQIEKMLGYSPQDCLAPDFFPRLLHPEDRQRVLAEVERTHRTGEPFSAEYRVLAADGRVVWLLDETIAVRDDEYRPLFLQGFLVDVTERRAAVEALQRNEALYRRVLESSSDLVVLLDRDGTLRYTSPSIERLLGYDPAESVGLPLAERLHPEDLVAVHAYFRNLAEDVAAAPMPLRLRHTDGHWVEFEGVTSVIRDDDGRATGFVNVSRPVRERVRAYAANAA